MSEYEGPERRRYNDSTAEWMQGLPVWAKFLFQVLFIYGPLAVIALLSFYIGSKHLPSIQLELTLVKEQLKHSEERANRFEGLLQETLTTTRFVLIEYCSQGKNDTERRSCYERYRDFQPK